MKRNMIDFSCIRDRILVLLLLTNGVFPSVVPSSSPSEQTCNSCCQGPPGAPGVNGVPGIPGSHGNTGTAGRDGFAGRNGMSGRGGEKGDSGSKGSTGAGERGPPGFQGPSGERGEPGLRGLPGKTGPVGPVGPAGPMGTLGSPGIRGESGRIAKSAFTAMKKTTQIAGADSEIITFEEAPVNIGGHFDLGTNRFTCHFPGIYFFYFSVHAIGGANPDIGLIKDSVHTGVTARTQLYKVQIGTATLLPLEVGNQVWLHFGNAGEGIAGLYGQFVGYLLFDLE